MMDKIKSLRLNVSLSGILCLVLGVICIVWPGEVTVFLAKMLGAILLLVGVSMFLGKVFEETHRSSGMLVSVVIMILGIWIWTKPAMAASLLPIVIGVILVVGGIQDLNLAFSGRAVNAPRWWSPLILGAINILAGVLAVLYAFGVVKLGMILLGLMLVYEGITSLFVVHKVNKAERGVVVDSVILEEEDVDASDWK